MSDEKPGYNAADHMLNLKGKDYLPVAARIVWLRHDHPDAQIRTRLVEHNPEVGFALYRAEVTLPSGGYAEATATQSRKQFGDYLEKCETKAIGRALGFLGYGTMAAFEDEPDNPVIPDAPVDRPQPRPAPASTGTPAPGGEHPLLATIRDDTADPKKRKTALHNWFMRANTLDDLRQDHEAVKGSGVPESDLAAAFNWHAERILPQRKAAAPAAPPSH